ncbi:MAG: FAD-dependent oxidoreductase [Bacteroidetes bacterium CG12_big_fil_rev_8_21_14_0_65_60_17]|nr:MAG: FAD-dependent oxidoreductase [Bacteroidetes bacterium CG12_big_fil_rev_8_21_14_0_65_60_17]
MPDSSAETPHVLIVGGGFAGLNAARSLDGAPVRVTLLDRENYHLFQPLLYQVATAALNASDIAVPLRAILRKQKNVSVVLGEARCVDLDEKAVHSGVGALSYDYLILATGATHSYFGNDSWASSAPGLKTIEDALDIRKRILLAYEAAELEPDMDVCREWLTFAVVGGGPTGVELAGALAEIGKHTLANDFRRIDPTQVRVLLVEGNDRILNAYPEKLSEKATQHLEKLGVEVLTGSYATSLTDDCLQVGDRIIHARTLLWAAGVKASPISETLGVPLDRAGRVTVEPDLSLASHPEVFIAGDLAHIEGADGPVPGVARAAIQAGVHAAKSIVARLEQKPSHPFVYRDKGSMATIGRAAAVARIGNWNVHGWLAWVMWLFVHVIFLVGFRNRFQVMMGWAWSYITFQRGARLITGHKPDLHSNASEAATPIPVS